MEMTLDRTERALGGGVEVLQLRAKDWEARPILELGERMLALARRYGVPFFLNDRPDLAALLGADGVHLGQGDLTPMEARRFFQGFIGRSTHAPEQALRALEEGADYLSVGPVWETPTKPGRKAAGLGYVRWAAENLGERPWFAIGGIDLTNLDRVLEAGARRIVVVRAILDAQDPEGAAKAFRERLYGVA
ncbi:thiamine-phosphate synthase [Thermus sp. LT1-2-5]